MADYIEVQDVKEIRRLSKQLSEILAADFPLDERRTLGSPSGNWAADVSFKPDAGEKTFWWSHRPKDKRGLALNFFGHGEPGASEVLLIGIQFNMSVAKFVRTTGGTFLKKKGTDQVFLAHRGIVTVGRSRLVQEDVLNATRTKTVEAETGKKTQRFMIVASLGTKLLSKKIETFALEIRETARMIGQQRDDAKTIQEIEKQSRARTDMEVVKSLGAYFREQSGKVPIPAREATTADRFHGDVVEALAKLFEGATCLKSGFVDMAAVTRTKALIFEVKTSSKSQSVYTAVGQLLMHAPLIQKHAKGFSVQQVAVLPEDPNAYFANGLKRLGISNLVYTRSDSGKITFQNYDDLLS